MAVRLIQISIDPACGVLDEVPSGQSKGEYIEWIGREVHRNFGTPTHKFLKYLVRALDKDRAATICDLERRIERARKKLLSDDVSGEGRRVAKYFALAYAAGCFAIDEGILPITRRWLRKSIEFTFERHRVAVADAPSVDPVEVFRQSIQSKIEMVIDLDDEKVSATAIEDAVGFMKDNAGVRELLFTERQFRRLLPPGITSKRLCDALKQRCLLIHDVGDSATTKNQTKRRLIKGEPRRRVYCISSAILS